MDNIEINLIIALGSGPKTVWWLARLLDAPESYVQQAIALATHDGFVEKRGDEYLYPQTDRRDGVRRKRGKRLKTWTQTRTYYSITGLGRILLPLNQIIPGVVK